MPLRRVSETCWVVEPQEVWACLCLRCGISHTASGPTECPHCGHLYLKRTELVSEMGQGTRIKRTHRRRAKAKLRPAQGGNAVRPHNKIKPRRRPKA